LTTIVEFQDVHLRKASPAYPVAADIKNALMDTLLKIKWVKGVTQPGNRGRTR
jgi:hypothetical protein